MRSSETPHRRAAAVVTSRACAPVRPAGGSSASPWPSGPLLTGRSRVPRPVDVRCTPAEVLRRSAGDRVLGRVEDGDRGVEPGDSKILRMRSLVTTRCSHPPASRACLRALTSTPRPVESRKATSERSTTSRTWPSAIRASSSVSRPGAVKTSTSPRALTTDTSPSWRVANCSSMPPPVVNCANSWHTCLGCSGIRWGGAQGQLPSGPGSWPANGGRGGADAPGRASGEDGRVATSTDGAGIAAIAERLAADPRSVGASASRHGRGAPRTGRPGCTRMSGVPTRSAGSSGPGCTRYAPPTWHGPASTCSSRPGRPRASPPPSACRR